MSVGCVGPLQAQQCDGHPPLYWAAASGNTEVMAALIREVANVQWRHPTTGSTALIAATLAGHSRAVQLLLSHGADPNERMNAAGIGPLLAAAMKERPGCAHLLLTAGADLVVSSPYFGTALSLAAQKGHWRTLGVLQRPLICLARQRLAVATAMIMRPSRDSFPPKVQRASDTVPLDLPYDVLVRLMELLSESRPSYLFAVRVAAEAGARYKHTAPTHSVLRAGADSIAMGTATPSAPDTGCFGSLQQDQFLQTRTSTMDATNAPELGFDFGFGSGQPQQHQTEPQNQVEPQSTLVLEFEVPALSTHTASDIIPALAHSVCPAGADLFRV